jgi:hypothetical protein
MYGKPTASALMADHLSYSAGAALPVLDIFVRTI